MALLPASGILVNVGAFVFFLARNAPGRPDQAGLKIGAGALAAAFAAALAAAHLAEAPLGYLPHLVLEDVSRVLCITIALALLAQRTGYVGAAGWNVVVGFTTLAVRWLANTAAGTPMAWVFAIAALACSALLLRDSLRRGRAAQRSAEPTAGERVE
jgi:hypothetical protein